MVNGALAQNLNVCTRQRCRSTFKLINAIG
jgi:hypothetical protein